MAKIRAVLPQEITATFPVIAKDIVDLGRMFFKEEGSLSKLYLMK
ncbi:MAG: hypothetical protein R2728_12910 [Chitinophagales bacterium]